MQGEVVRDKRRVRLKPRIGRCILVKLVERDNVFEDPRPRIVEIYVKL